MERVRPPELAPESEDKVSIPMNSRPFSLPDVSPDSLGSPESLTEDKKIDASPGSHTSIDDKKDAISFIEDKRLDASPGSHTFIEDKKDVSPESIPFIEDNASPVNKKDASPESITLIEGKKVVDALLELPEPHTFIEEEKLDASPESVAAEDFESADEEFLSEQGKGLSGTVVEDVTTLATITVFTSDRRI
ncbi:hypothetical protein L6452_31771 [Arctium lappa]|uniref:Uncharacterized protein n=1 Tax=Arctium lappa TaxID=4217 RepID=A0ACB8Z2F7_ARCLA|nr:hypothetical protein L6452_31771 [Arctium lappa]